MKNISAVVVIVLCLGGVIFLAASNRSSRRAGVESLKAGESLWVQCGASDCKAAYQIDKRDYFRQVEAIKQADPRAENRAMAPPIACRECQKHTAMRAVKCERCEHLFLYGQRRGKRFDYADRCPQCDYSKLEQDP